MRIFEDIGKKILVNEYFPNYEKVKEFKIEEIKKIPKEERLLSATSYGNADKIHRRKVGYRLMELNYETPNLTLGYLYHKLECSNLSEKNKRSLIEQYINLPDYGVKAHFIFNSYDKLDSTDKNKFHRFVDVSDKKTLKNLKYFLTTQNYKEVDYYTQVMEGIINVPESLFLYHILLSENYEEIKNRDISKQIGLFEKQNILVEFDKLEVLELDKKIEKSGIIERSNFEKLMEQVRNSKKVLKYIKR